MDKPRQFRLFPYIVGRNTKAWRLQERTTFLGLHLWNDFLREDDGSPIDVMQWDAPNRDERALSLEEVTEVIHHLNGKL